MAEVVLDLDGPVRLDQLDAGESVLGVEVQHLVEHLFLPVVELLFLLGLLLSLLHLLLLLFVGGGHLLGRLLLGLALHCNRYILYKHN